jgi:phycoerythrin-associated linker protein
MDLQKFLELRTGKWFAQRTSYYLDAKIVENSKAEITIEKLSLDQPEILKLSQQHHLTLTDSCEAVKISWDNSVDWGKTKQTGSVFWVLIPNSDNPLNGQLLQSNSQVIGNYRINKDEALTLTIEENNHHTEERQWFASENLFLCSMFIKGEEGFIQTSFYSEIRKIPPKES